MSAIRIIGPVPDPHTRDAPRRLSWRVCDGRLEAKWDGAPWVFADPDTLAAIDIAWTSARRSLALALYIDYLDALHAGHQPESAA